MWAYATPLYNEIRNCILLMNLLRNLLSSRYWPAIICSLLLIMTLLALTKSVHITISLSELYRGSNGRASTIMFSGMMLAKKGHSMIPIHSSHHLTAMFQPWLMLYKLLFNPCEISIGILTPYRLPVMSGSKNICGCTKRSPQAGYREDRLNVHWCWGIQHSRRLSMTMTFVNSRKDHCLI